MPAKFIKTYKYTAPDGMQFDTLIDEQKWELKALFCGDKQPTDAELRAITDMVNNRDQVVAILRQKERKNASPKTRKPRKTAGKVEAPANRE